MAKRNYLVDIDLNNNELQNAVIHKYASNPAATLAEIGKIIYNTTNSTTYVLNNVAGEATWEPLGKSSSSGGGIFVMSVAPFVAGQNVNIVTANDSNEDITEVKVTSRDLNFTVMALSGNKTLQPSLTYQLSNDTGDPSVIFSLGALSKQGDRPTYLKTYHINLIDGSTTYNYVTFYSNEGSSKKIKVSTDVLPEITGITFGNYPTNQTELKEGDFVNITINYDVKDSNKTLKEITIYGEGGFKATSYIDLSLGYTGSHTVQVTAAAAPIDSELYGVVVSITRSDNAVSSKFYSNSVNPTNGVNAMYLNNTYPQLGLFNIDYNLTGATAISLTKGASVGLSLLNAANLGAYTATYGTIQTNGANQLNIGGSTSLINSFIASQNVSTTWSGYNVDTPNYIVTVKKTSNQAPTSKSAIINIASIAPSSIEIAVYDTSISPSIVTPRLISSAAGYSHQVKVTSNQKLMSLSLNAGSSGGVMNSTFTVELANRLTATSNIIINDTITKGNYNFTGLVATNIAGISTNTINTGSQYIVGGFNERTVTMAGSARTVSVPGIAVTQTGYDTGKCVISWQGLIISSVLQPTGPRFVKGTALTPSQPTNNAWCIDDTSNVARATEIRFLNSGEAVSSETTVTIKENA